MRTLSELIEVAKEIEQTEANLHWFRGASGDYPLLPSLYRRDTTLEAGQGIFRDFRQMAPCFAESSSAAYSEFDFYSLARHHGLVTRLLDWSGSILVALFFSLYEKRPAKAAIWCLNPCKMNEQSIKLHEVITSRCREVKDHLDISTKGRIQEKAIALNPQSNNSRIKMQQGFYTFHGRSRVPLEDQFPDCITKIEIDPKAAESLRDELQYAGIKRSFIYPDLDNYVKDLHAEYHIFDKSNSWDEHQDY
ncbi:MAG: FRG domain-containing protein [Proteobacteria bacterium]|nr:MAG: FRG domain-containing protein [Pseudomonadota bacterium]